MLRLPRIRPLPRILSTPTSYSPQSAFWVTARMSSSTARPLHVAPTPEEEEAILQSETEAIAKWWQSPRWKGIKRPYSARDVATKRGTLEQSYPSSVMAKKLFSLLSERAEQGLPVHTSTTPSTSNNFLG
jgi:isocitrate lyase